VAVFGQKDAQQLHLVQRMVKDLDFQIEILKCPTIREPDGLALSSRNAFLKRIERKQANILHLALDAGLTAFHNGERSLRKIQETMHAVLNQLTEFQTDYCTAVDDNSFRESDPIPEQPRFIVAGKLGSVRLIDNKSPHDVSVQPELS
jgi:pantoate--beta-alanine ligase